MSFLDENFWETPLKIGELQWESLSVLLSQLKLLIG